ncbi:MAG: hypothetical protein ACOC8G_01125, partial [Thermodesulfobacteriota bacterium]
RIATLGILPPEIWLGRRLRALVIAKTSRAILVASLVTSPCLMPRSSMTNPATSSSPTSWAAAAFRYGATFQGGESLAGFRLDCIDKFGDFKKVHIRSFIVVESNLSGALFAYQALFSKKMSILNYLRDNLSSWHGLCEEFRRLQVRKKIQPPQKKFWTPQKKAPVTQLSPGPIRTLGAP